MGLRTRERWVIKQIMKSQIFPICCTPLEGFWWQENVKGIDYQRKEDMHFISIIRVPNFVLKKIMSELLKKLRKKGMNFSKVKFPPYDEGIYVQSMHLGKYDNEVSTVDKMHEYMIKHGYELASINTRYPHEIYSSDPRKCDTSNLKTVIRHPIKKVI